MDGCLQIETQRMILVPMTYRFVEGILSGNAAVYGELGLAGSPDWPNADTLDIMPKIKEALASRKMDGYGAWLFIEKKGNTIIGDGGFKGPPDQEGIIDLGYGAIERKRKQGYAMEAVRALFKWALTQQEVHIITADCLIGNEASASILRNLGMAETKRVDGLAYFRYMKEVDTLLV